MGDFIISGIKFILAVLLLPVVIASAVTFYDHLGTYHGNYFDFFVWGACAFLLSFLFVYQFWGVYEFGQKIIMGIFKLFSPFDRFISYVIPFYFTAIMMAFYVVDRFFDATKNEHYFVFFAGFALAMHILLVAQELQEQEKSAIKSSHLFIMTIVFVFNCMLVVLLFDLIIDKFSFPAYFKSTAQEAQQIYAMVFEKFIAFRVK